MSVSSTILKTCSILNINADESIASNAIFKNRDPSLYIVSECDEELLILIEFKTVTKLQNIVFYASNNDESSDMSPPKLIYIYTPKNLNINFDDVSSLKATKSLKCSTSKLRKGQLFKINNKGKFNKVKRLAIFIKSNQKDTETTYLNGIWLNYDQKAYTFDAEDKDKMQQLDAFVATLSNDSTGADDGKAQSMSWFKHDHPRPREYSCTLKDCQHLQRISDILNNYNAYILSQKDDEKEQNAQALDKIYPSNYTNTDLLNDEHHLLLFHANEFEHIYDLLLERSNDKATCQLSLCAVMKRNQRDRSLYANNPNMLHKLYCTDTQHHIVQQQFIDRIHCHYFHTFDIGYRMTQQEKQNIMDDDAKTEEDDVNVDVSLARVHHLIESKRRLYRNVQGLERLNSRNNKYTCGIQRDEKKEGSGIPSPERYSYGVRYFYWQNYKQNTSSLDPAHNNMEEKWIDGLFVYHNHAQKQMISPANHDASLGDWYVSNKYDSFKQEMLNNEICVIGKGQFNTFMDRAAWHEQTDHVKQIKCPRSQTAQFYEVKFNSLIKQNHLVSMMVYCNCDVLQRKLSGTYRRQSKDESNESMKKRHSNFYFLGRFLRESVECFGLKQPSNANLHLWHGIDKHFAFSSMFAFIKGPLSTTTDYAVAVNFCQNKGTLLQLNMNSYAWDYTYHRVKADNPTISVGDDDDRICCFDCAWISDFANENEIFCIGGLYKLTFDAIIQAPSGINYLAYIKAIKQMTYNMSVGDLPKETDMAKTVQEQQMVFRLISDALYKLNPKHKYAHPFTSCPDYVKNILHQHSQNIKTIFFSNTEDTRCKIHDLIFKYDNDWIKIDLLLRMFPNVQHICYNAMQMSKAFLQAPSVYESVLYALKDNSSNELQYIEVLIDPSCFMEINDYIAKYKPDFAKYSWDIEGVCIEDVHREVTSIQRREVLGLDGEKSATVTHKGTKTVPDVMKTEHTRSVKPAAKPRTAILMAHK
eukprot:57005_1